MGRHRMIREEGGEFWRKSETEKVRGVEREEEQDWELGTPTKLFLELKDEKWAKWTGHQSPLQGALPRSCRRLETCPLHTGWPPHCL